MQNEDANAKVEAVSAATISKTSTNTVSVDYLMTRSLMESSVVSLALLKQ